MARSSFQNPFLCFDGSPHSAGFLVLSSEPLDELQCCFHAGEFVFGQRDIPSDLPPIVAISSQGSHTVALTADGQVRAWGANTYGECITPWNLPQVAAIAAGQGHTVAILQDGSIRCWGNNWYGQCTVPYSGADLAALLAEWGTKGAVWDLDQDGTVGGSDLAILLGNWGSLYGNGAPMGPVISVSAAVHTVVVSVP
jgi:hypothetical protein